MKNIKVLILMASLCMFNACDVIDLKPANMVPKDVAPQTPSTVEGVIVGVYEAAQRGYYLGTVQRGYPFGAASIEQGDMKGEDMYNDQLFYEVTYTNAWNATTANNNGMWISLYRLINRANDALEVIDEAENLGIITKAQADNYRGEMYFMRALSYHELLIHFSRPYSDDPSAMGVPYHTKAYNEVTDQEEGLAVGRGTVQQAYTKLLQDLDMAENLLSANKALFRASKGAAIALKTRVKLHMRDWNGVLTEAAKLETIYGLETSPETPFTTPGSAENIFLLDNSTASNSGVNGALVNMYGNPAFGGRGLVKISPVIWKETFWLDGDLRRTLLTTSNVAGIYTYKYRAYGTFDEPTPLIRYAEVVLNAAEAYARLGGAANLDEAIDLLNSVRDRSKPAAAPSFDLATLVDADGVLDAIWKERRIEFLAEGRRWSDIHRLSGEGLMDGIPLKAQSRSVTSINQYAPAGSVTLDHSLSYDNDLFIWPIPIEEVLANPTLAEQQNPGY